MNYNLKAKIEETLNSKGKTRDWLAGQLGISEKTLYNYKLIGNLSLEMILKMSAALEFNFLEDYNEWLRENNEPAIASWSEEKIEYKKTSKQLITMSLHLRGEADVFSKSFTAILNTVRKECETYGLELV
jgi:hypothetical protein